ncbi:hypothetical protein [Emticicia sp. 17c]
MLQLMRCRLAMGLRFRKTLWSTTTIKQVNKRTLAGVFQAQQ